jgi:RNA polymerase sigma factor (sigma-70 family)
MSDTSDDELMQQYRDGDILAFQELHRRYKSELYRYVWWRTPQPQWVEEIVQDTWVNLLRARNRYQPNAAFRVYLYLLARNRLFEMLQQNQHLVSTAGSTKDGRDLAFVLADAMREKPAPRSFFDRSPQRNPWGDAVTSLPSELGEVVILQKFNGLSLIEIAEIVGVPVGTVRARLRDAVFIMKPLLPGAPPRKVLKLGEKEVNDVDDIALEAFIKGTDGLTLHLRGVEQSEPSAQTEAQILKRVSFALEQDTYLPIPVEVVEHVPAAASSSTMWMLWAIPVVLGALVLVGFIVRQSGPDEPRAALTGGSADTDSAPRQAPTRQSEMISHSQAPKPQENVAQYPQGGARVVTGQAVEGVTSAAAVSTPEGGTVHAEKWLAVVNDLLKAGLKYQAAEEFAKFRAANPDYPVPASMLAQLQSQKK